MARDKAVKREFDSSVGRTESWETDWPSGGVMLAYLDTRPDGLANATVFDPYRGTFRTYEGRKPENARRIVERHLERQGWE